MSDSLKEICIKMWKEYEPKLRVFCRAKLVNYQEDADDILSRTFQLFWAKLLSDGVPPYPERWLYKTAHNLIKTEYRKQNRNKEKVFHSANNEVTLYIIDDLDDKIADEQLYSELIVELNEKLSEEEKLIMKYSIVEEKSYAEIAGVLGISELAVKQRKYRLVKKTYRMKQEKMKKLGFF